jgi:hypothetical protein
MDVDSIEKNITPHSVLLVFQVALLRRLEQPSVFHYSSREESTLLEERTRRANSIGMVKMLHALVAKDFKHANGV